MNGTKIKIKYGRKLEPFPFSLQSTVSSVNGALCGVLKKNIFAHVFCIISKRLLTIVLSITPDSRVTCFFFSRYQLTLVCEIDRL